MSYTNELLDKYKAAHQLESDYAAAQALGLRPNRLSNYRTGVSHADDKTAVMLADALGLDRLQTIAKINMERARDSKERAFWRQIAAAAALFFAVALPYTAHADVTPGAALTDAPSRHYAKLWLEVTRLARFLRWALSRLMDRAHAPSALLV